jgi:acetolactate synthase-1/2/3 large subunit
MSAPAQESTAEVMAAHLVSAGVPRVFAYPGDPTIDFLESCRRAGLDVILPCREGSAAFMAEATAMITGVPGVCVSTLGPGSTALLNGVAAATLDRVPMLAISGQIAAHLEQVFTHQVVDHGRLYAGVTKWAGRVEASAAAITMRKALKVATAERPGAVHLSCTADVFSQAASDDGVRPVGLAPDGVFGTLTVSGERSWDALLAAARRPVVLAGIGAVRSAATTGLTALAEALSAPVVVAPMAKGVLPEDHPLFAGVLDMACPDVVWDLVNAADLVVCVGFDAVELIKPWRVVAPVIHIDTTPNTDQVYYSDCDLVGDINAICLYLAESWAGEPRWTEAEVATHVKRLRDTYYSGAVAGVLNPTDVVDGAVAIADTDTIVTTDVGSHKLLVGQGWRSLRPRRTLMTNGLSAMGFGLPAAIAAKLACPAGQVIALIGDGGMNMVLGELRVASELRLGILVVVFADGSLNRIELKQQARGLPSTATRIGSFDLVTVATGMGCDAVRVASPAELDKALAAPRVPTRPLVVEARIDPSQYLSQF